MKTFIPPAEVAELLELRPAQFRTRRARLIEELGFPPPVPWARSRWRRTDVEAWIAGVYVAPETAERERASAARRAVMRHMARAG